MSQVVSAAALLGTLGIDTQTAAATTTGTNGAATQAAERGGAAVAAEDGHSGVSVADAAADLSDVNESALDRDLRALFDARRPFRALTSGPSAPVLQRSLNAELTCPVCLGIIRDCTAVMECLHRFCAACIEKSLRFGKKECPSCRVTVASRRNLRKDDAFNAVIGAIYPDPAQAEAAHESYIQEVIKSYNVRKFGTIASKGSRQQKDHARKSTKRPASPPPSAGFDGAAGAAPMAKRPRNPSKPEPISFSIVQHPALAAAGGQLAASMRLANKFVRTSRYITVLLLKKWLQLKLLTQKPTHADADAREATKVEAEMKTDGAETKAEEQGEATPTATAPPATAGSTEGTDANEAKAEGSAVPATAGSDAHATAAAAPAAPSDESSKMEDTGVRTDATAAAAAAALSSSPAPVAPSPLTSFSSSSPPVRFVLYVRAFDTHLLDPSDSVGESGSGLGGVAGEETFVPLASDLTLDYIEEHMWNSEGRAADRQAAAINADLARAAAAAEGPEADPTALLQRAFRQSFAVCSAHRKIKARCTEDCTDRMAAWHDFLARESEKFNQYRAKLKEQQQQQQTQAATTAGAASDSAASNGVAVVSSSSSSSSSILPHPAFIALPHKKRRLVLYFSVVGPDGQLLTATPVLAPDIVQRFVIPDPDEEEEGEGEGQRHTTQGQEHAQQGQEQTEATTQGETAQAEEGAAPGAPAAPAAPAETDEPTAMQLDDSNDAPAAAAPAPAAPADTAMSV